ncbi:hypothetical protein [Methylorubrum sp. Q1]|uniref:hypothetical protein n=1 Tax=Methylorubrum sp. Q1 TaxID=2562453 RepID=UPI001AED41B1|nr:hypothetical protein [Methylorubrum sp. Q1]
MAFMVVRKAADSCPFGDPIGCLSNSTMEAPVVEGGSVLRALDAADELVEQTGKARLLSGGIEQQSAEDDLAASVALPLLLRSAGLELPEPVLRLFEPEACGLDALGTCRRHADRSLCVW